MQQGERGLMPGSPVDDSNQSPGREVSEPGSAATDEGSATGPRVGPESFSNVLNIPNQLTIARLVLSVVFFAILVANNYQLLGRLESVWLNVSILVFALAAVTDFLDGYLARRWNMLSAFGRLADPIVDKVFICGSFVLLTRTSTLVAPWIPVVLLMREFLISGLRSYLESHGVPFGAGAGGKLKMVIQSITIPVILFYEANARGSTGFRWTAIVLLGLTILLTLSSSVQYLFRAARILRASPESRT